MKSILPVVDYDLALLLKKMRFSEPVCHAYRKGKVVEDENGQGYCDYNGLGDTDIVSAPFLQEVQAWLSKRKRTDVLVYRDVFFDQTGKYYAVVIRRRDHMVRETKKAISYNLALEAGVRAAVGLLCKKRKRK